MAVDDVVNGISAEATILDYQPAAGVEAAVLGIITGPATAAHILYDGTNSAVTSQTNEASSNGAMPITKSVGVTNTRYLRIPAFAAQKTAYTGIVTK